MDTQKVVLFCYLWVTLILSPLWQGRNLESAEKTKVLTKIVIAAPSTMSMSSLPFSLAKKLGFYQKEGLNADVFLEMKSNIIIAGLSAGQIDYGGTVGSLLSAAAAGVPIKVLFVTTDSLPHFIFAKEGGIRSLKELKGKTFGVSSIGSSEYYVGRKIIKHYGLDPDKDVTTVAIGHGNRFMVISTGIVDLSLLPSVDAIMARRKGYPELGRVADIVKTLSIGLGTTDKRLREKRDEVKSALRGTLGAFLYIKEHKKESVDFMVKEWGYKRDIADGHYDADVKLYTKVGIVDEKIVQDDIEMARFLGMVKGDRPVPTSQIVDFSPLREVVKEMGLTP